MEANGNILVRGPMDVRPATATWLTSSHPSASATSLPTVQNGPIRTFGPTLAPVSTIELGWIAASAILVRYGCSLGRVDDHGADLGFGRNQPVDLGFAVEPPGAATTAHLAHVIADLVAGNDGPAEFRAVDAHEVHELRLVGLARIVDAERARGLCQALDDEDPRHHREARKVALEEGLVYGHVLQADGGMVAIHVEDAIDEQKRIAMREQVQHPRNIGRAELRFRRHLVHFLYAPCSYRPGS